MEAKIIRIDAPWLDVVEGAYRDGASEAAWAQAVITAFQRVVENTLSLGLHVIEYPTSGEQATIVSGSRYYDHSGASHEEAAARLLGVRLTAQTLFPPFVVSTSRKYERYLVPEARPLLSAVRHALGAEDLLGLLLHPMPGTMIAISAASAGRIYLTRMERLRLARMALHLETGYRLLKRPKTMKAYLRADGKLLHREPDAPATDLLQEGALKVTRARSDRERSEALTLWTALLDGAVTLVPKVEGSKVHYAILENGLWSKSLRPLTRRERDVMTLASRGLSSKLIAYGLGIVESTVSGHLDAAASKLGLLSRVDLIRVAALLAQDERADLDDDASLTQAESEVLELLQQGLSNRQIASVRMRSVRTIANQVASLLQKKRAPTRRALVARSTPL